MTSPNRIDRYPALLAMQAVPLFSHLDFHFTEAGDGWAEIVFEATPKTHNVYGILHGGVWLMLADAAMGGALATVAEPDERVITAQSEFRWLRALKGDSIRVCARVLRRGRTLSHCVADLYDDVGETVGLGTGTYVILPPAD